MNPNSSKFSFARFASLLALVCALSACNRNVLAHHEYVWVSAPQANLRDRVAALYNKVGTVKNGDRLDVLEHQKRFVRVRTDGGQEGWLEERYIVTEEVYKGFQKLDADNAAAPAQGHAITRAALNIHITPGRDSEHLYQLNESERVDLIRRGTGEKAAAGARPAPRPSPKPSAKSAAKDAKSAAAKPADAKPAAVKPADPKAADVKSADSKSAPAAAPDASEEPPTNLEDWWLVRDSRKHVGWVLARMIDIDVPLDVAQYAEGQRIVGAYVLDTVNDPGYEPASEDSDAGSSVQSGSTASPQPAAATSAPATPAADYHVRPQYLVLFTEPKDGLPFDYNQARVFTWNTRRHRYETAYREHGIYGLLPVTIARENFDKEGTLPTFTLHVKDENGKIVERKYKLNQPIVRRVTAPGEQPQKMAQLPGSEKKNKAKKSAAPRHSRKRR